MNVWKLTAANKIELFDEPVPEAGDGKIKVRITKVMLCNQDAPVFRGEFKTKYPLVPGRLAVGIVAEDYKDIFPKGTRVLLHAYHPETDTGTEKKDFSLDDYEVCGKTRDGFLRDIVTLSPDELTPLPDSVSDEDALLTHHVALAKAIVDKLDVKKGQHIAVAGASGFGILICQLLIYQQAAPILISADQSRLDFANTCGVYYTIHVDDNLLDRVAELTGGRLADGSVFVTNAKDIDPSVAFSVCAREANVVIGGYVSRSVNIDATIAIRKEISIHCLAEYVENLEMAINLVANKGVNLQNFTAKAVDPNTLLEFYPSYVGFAEEEEKDYLFIKML
ncbi:MAG: zinc-binding dehydrogenase [Clostridia bacterium]|nr:zinc-binding dehydrogenase [Clostridia bacterium]MDE6677069.1 zinc-binding dehydrogenase [Clostridia bacterium]